VNHDSSDIWQLATEVLDELGIESALVGGRAANIYRPRDRTTLDSDFLVRSHDGIRERLEELGFSVKVQGTTIRAARGDERYDFTLADWDYHFVAIERAQQNRGVITIEDSLVQKLLAWRPQDREDIESILSTDPQYDKTYVRRWCEVFEIDSRLDTMTLHRDTVQRHLRRGNDPINGRST
jgi:hypothetical protein